MGGRVGAKEEREGKKKKEESNLLITGRIVSFLNQISRDLTASDRKDTNYNYLKNFFFN